MKLKTIFTSFLVFLLTTVNSIASTGQGLKLAYDDFYYSVTVEWDQKDQKFFDAQMNKFQDALRDLEAQGLTKAEIQDFAANKVSQDPSISKEFQIILASVELQDMSPMEAANYIHSHSHGRYAQGSSWDGNTGVYLLGTVLASVVVMFVYLAATEQILCKDSNGNSMKCAGSKF